MVNEPTLRILIIGLNYSPEPTGIAPYTTRLAERLASDGFKVRVLTGFPHYPEWRLRAGYTGWTRREVIGNVDVLRVRHYVPTRISALARLHLEMSFGTRILFSRWHRPDVVLLVTPALMSGAFALLRARLGFGQRPSVGFWVQDIYSKGLQEITGSSSGSRSIAARAMQLVEGAIFRSASGVSVIHERFKGYLCKDLGLEENRVTVIPNWTHISSPSKVDRSDVRSQWGWKESDTVVLHAGNIGVKQALENVVEAARLAGCAESNVKFVLLGDGNRRGAIESLATGVDHLQFIDPLPEEQFRSVLVAADILLVNEMAGVREMAVPSKLTSYFAAGLPVIAATEPDSTTAGEIERAKAGVRVNPADPAGLLEAAELLARDPHLAKQLGTAGVEYASNCLSQNKAIVLYEAWLRSLAEVSRRRNAEKLRTRKRGKRVD
jgi:colanic acid biosynthesis glycosyl transferase WcaI